MDMKRWKLLLGALVLVLGACAPFLEAGGPLYRVLEVELLTPDATERWAYFYGDPQTILLNGEALKLDPAPDRPHIWAVPGALWVDGQPNLREALPPLRLPAETVEALPGFDFVLTTRVGLKGAWLFDGRWYRLADEVPAGVRLRSEGERDEPQLAGLTSEEARVVLDEVLARRGHSPLVLYQLADPLYPDYRFDPSPVRYRKASFAVQYGVPKEFVLGGNDRPRRAAWEVLQQGPYSAYADAQPYALLAVSEPAFLQKVWPLAAGRRLPRPAPPAVDFGRESVAAFFWGTKPTGGYALKVAQVTAKGDVAVVQLELIQPKPGSLATQAITSPFLLLRLAGKPAKVRFIDRKGRLLAESRAQ